MADSPSTTLEVAIQAISAVATTAAAIFAALSARSAGAAAREMEQSRYITVAPVLTLDRQSSQATVSAHPGNRKLSAFSRVGGDFERPALDLENHGSGPALNVHVSYRVLEAPTTFDEEIDVLTTRRAGVVRALHYREGQLEWSEQGVAAGQFDQTSTGETFFSSIAAGEKVEVPLNASLFNRLFRDAVVATARDATLVRHVVVNVACTSSLGQRLEGEQRFRIKLSHPPLLGANNNPNNVHVGVGLELDLDPGGFFGDAGRKGRKRGLWEANDVRGSVSGWPSA